MTLSLPGRWSLEKLPGLHIARFLLLVSSLVVSAVNAATPFDTSAVQRKVQKSALPADWHRGAFMEIFVRAYQDSNGDGIGDLRGLISRLDYLQALGIKGLWLMPVTTNADGDHGYATTDFRAIDPAYGTLADFDELLAQAHRRGMGVIVDYVINHSAATHPAFQEALKGKHSLWRDWYVWSQDAPGGWDIWGKNPWYHVGAEPWKVDHANKLPPVPAGARDFYFGTFGPHIPDFNFRNPAVVQYHRDSLRFWLNRGIDGFRLDATPHLIENSAKNWNDQPQSRALTYRMQQLVKSYPNRYLVCEATANPKAWGDARVCGGAFAFGITQHFVDAARGKPDSVAKVADYYRTASSAMATFVSNHDSFAGRRLADQLNGDVPAMQLAAATYLLLPGTPFIYYGEEVGMRGAPGAEPDFELRAPMSWTSDAGNAGFTTGKPFRPIAPNVSTHNAQQAVADPAGLYAFYRAMLQLRNTQPSIAKGRYAHAFSNGLVLGFERIWKDQRTLVLMNYGKEPTTIALPNVRPGTLWQPLYPVAGAVMPTLNGADGPTKRRVEVLLPPQSVQVVALRPRR